MTPLLMGGSCAINCPSCDNRPDINIPDLPDNVYYKQTVIPDTNISKKKTKQLLLEYENNEVHNIKAIKSAIKNHKTLQRIYQKKLDKARK